VAVALTLALAPAALADAPIRPDPRFTPGAVATTDANLVCQSGYARSVRHTSGKLKAFIYREYGTDRRGGHYEIDHLIPLGLGGADVAANLWPEPRDAEPWNAGRKDRLEGYLHAAVCYGGMPLEQAQREIAGDWIAAYERYIGQQ
jgi:hypothetical protein